LETTDVTTRRDLVLGGMLVGASGLAWLSRARAGEPAVDQSVLEAALPVSPPGYRTVPEDGFVLPQRDALSEDIYDRYAVRGYAAEGAGLPPVRLVVAYGSVQDYGLQLHRPESCYPAAGFAIGARREVTLQLGSGRSVKAVALSASRSRRHEQILYWTRIGDQFPADLWEGRLIILRQALQRDLPDGALVRASLFSSDPDAALDQLKAFARSLCDAAGPAARRIMLGST
jgi:EpsI family protein